MEIVLIAGVVLFIVVFFAVRKASTRRPAEAPRASTVTLQRTPTREEQILEENLPWLRERWRKAREERDANDLKTVPGWFFDDVTDRQLQKLQSLGLTVQLGRPTKGEASDLIGLFEPVEDENEEVLRFFKVSSRGMNQSRGRYEVARLLRDPENAKAWAARPASTMQREFYRFFDLPAPQGLTRLQADAAIREHESHLGETDEQKLDDWLTYQNIWDDLTDSSVREDYAIKKVSLSAYRGAIAALLQEGKTLEQLHEDLDIVVRKLVQLNPGLKKAV